MSQPSPLRNLLPDIYPTVVGHLPLNQTPSTLLALALADHDIYSIIHPLLHTRLVLKNENDALTMLQRLLVEPDLGKLVREIHILSELSGATCNGENPFDVVIGLEKVIIDGKLPYIHSLGLRLEQSWFMDKNYDQVCGYGHLRSNFWRNLRKNCPRIQSISLVGIRDDPAKSWLNGGKFVDLDFIKTKLCLEFSGFEDLFDETAEKLLKRLDHVSDTLETLRLGNCTSSWTPSSPLLKLTFAQLRSISLSDFLIENTAESMAFWERHPTLESVTIKTIDRHHLWFSQVPCSAQNFLPNLKHLKTHIAEIFNLAPILHQLVSLTVLRSLNGQVPHLLRSALPNGLPNLKSLNIDQISSNLKADAGIKGALWYETKEGEFCENNAENAAQPVWDPCYMRSIVLGAPNVEEIGFVEQRELAPFVKIAHVIAGFSKLRRLYIACRHTISDDMLLIHSGTLAKVCSSLETVVFTTEMDFPHLMARITRNETGGVTSIKLGTGFGMQFGSEDEAFPT